jgi:hypothetical protein
MEGNPMRSTILALVLVTACSSSAPKDIDPPAVTAGTGIKIDSATETISVDDSKVPMIADCPSGLVSRSSTGWQCVASAPDSALLAGKPASAYVTTDTTVTNASNLGGHPASYYLSTTATAANSSMLEGHHAADFLGISAQAADSAALQGHVPTDFLAATAQAVDSAKLGGVAASTYVKTTSGTAFDSGRLNGQTADKYATAVGGIAVSASNSAALQGHAASDFAPSIFHDVLPNGGFEDGMAGWTIADATPGPTPGSILLDSSAHSGNLSMHFVGSATAMDVAITGRRVAIRPGSQIRISAWGKGTNIVPGGCAWSTLYLAGRTYDKDGNGTGDKIDLGWPTGTFSWTQATNTATVSATAAYFQIDRVGMLCNSVGDGWLDDVRLEVGYSELSPAALPGLRFAHAEETADVTVATTFTDLTGCSLDINSDGSPLELNAMGSVSATAPSGVSAQDFLFFRFVVKKSGGTDENLGDANFGDRTITALGTQGFNAAWQMQRILSKEAGTYNIRIQAKQQGVSGSVYKMLNRDDSRCRLSVRFL